MVVADVDSVCFSLGSGWVAADVERGCFHFGSGRVVAPSLENTSAQGFHARGLGDAPEAYHRHQQETCIRHCSHTEGTAHASLCTAAVCAKHTEYHSVERRREETGRSGAGWLRTERAELEARERPRAVQRKWKGPQTESGVGRNNRLSQKKGSGPNQVVRIRHAI